MDVTHGINWLAVLAATVAAFMLGGLWFSVLFGNQWIAALGKPKEEMGMPGPSMALSFVTTLVMATAMSMIITRMPTMSAPGALRFGCAIGIGIVAMGMASDYAFTNWPRKLFWIQAGYHVVMVIVMALILGLWR